MRRLTKLNKQAKTARIFADRRDDPRAAHPKVVSGLTRISTW